MSDPESAGLPGIADDESSAKESLSSTREAASPQLAPLPPDREDGPLALDEFGTTAEEQRRGESLEGRLEREEPDVSPGGVYPGGVKGEEVSELDALSVDRDAASSALGDDDPVDPHLNSPVSMYDRMGADSVRQGRVGRLVQPDEGVHEDAESEEVAVDTGSFSGASAEELAMHEVTDEAESGLGPGSPGDGYIEATDT
ncbi:MAG: hypothetical protein H0T78_05400 [Longispora sp.]|nr:hypothetical protein [Longispora sp. (in: high G+C Gram-positive bacteria)]